MLILKKLFREIIRKSLKEESRKASKEKSRKVLKGILRKLPGGTSTKSYDILKRFSKGIFRKAFEKT